MGQTREWQMNNIDYLGEIKGQDQAVALLRQTIANRHLSHAYLFWGPKGIGKMSCALALARTVISRYDPQAEMFFRQGMHPDLLTVEKQENRTVITKEQVTGEIEPWLALKPYRSQQRVVILRDAHLMSTEAANALLKTLEEPPAYSLLVLVADEQNLLETIVSRCQPVRFFPVSENTVADFLQEQGIEPGRAEMAAHLSQGSFSNALQYSKSNELEEWLAGARRILADLAGGEVVSVYQAAEKMEKNGEMMSGILEAMLRDVIIWQQTEREDLLVLPFDLNLVRQLADRDTGRLCSALDEVHQLRTYYRRNANALLLSTNISYSLWEALK